MSMQSNKTVGTLFAIARDIFLFFASFLFYYSIRSCRFFFCLKWTNETKNIKKKTQQFSAVSCLSASFFYLLALNLVVGVVHKTECKLTSEKTVRTVASSYSTGMNSRKNIKEVVTVNSAR